ncbi:RNA polymerase factor sigma-54 [Tropicimonas isoalkanivorans]|uniref:RNA polymerase sigma-54 factor n=1 Tax=Tropicimonas isoalkanivorans TaxID=441112 RepID=A0A1I1H7P6_9RHOB|nr:RNA polymerase factor sigma-54 [Tropicimonas isoalkanivorans]SFC19735.1 RNA polymerase, sigma 54 subunit, RpoN/SigL [Tropicimonas isoalkanivorans]
MQLAQTLETRTTLVMTQRMQASLRILQMNNADLADFLAEKSLENPYVELRLPGSGASSEEFDRIAALRADGPSLYAHIAEQIDLEFSDPRLREVAYGFLEALEPSGWMTVSLEAVALARGVPVTVAGSVLKRMQAFEPTGIFARSLSECLMLQAEEEGLLTWELQALIENLPLLAEGRTAELADICDCEPEDIPEIAATLRQFDPKPGLRFDDDRPPVFPPDLTARRENGNWRVELNRSTLPAIEISNATPVQSGEAEARAFRARALSEARWLASTLLRRQTTLLQTATAIVAHQHGFLERGPGALEPLSLSDIGEVLDLHPSTISRAIAGRMIDTPIGALPLKVFFSRAFPTGAGGETASQDAVLDLVRRIVDGENKTRPLSDVEIADLAAKQGVKIARRTVAKFRGILGIGTSYARRKEPNAA